MSKSEWQVGLHLGGLSGFVINGGVRQGQTFHESKHFLFEGVPYLATVSVMPYPLGRKEWPFGDSEATVASDETDHITT